MPETLALTWETMSNWEAAGVRFYRNAESENLQYDVAEDFGRRVELNDFFMRFHQQIGSVLDLRGTEGRTVHPYAAVRYAVETGLMTEGETPWVPERVNRLKRELGHAEAVRDGHKSEWDEACKRVDTLKGQIRDEEARR